VAERAQKVVDLGLYATAVRDACLVLETRLRELSGSNLYVEKLVEHFISKLLESGRYIAAQLKILRGELRTIFKFVRDDYAHNLKSITADQCYAILGRISIILRLLDSIPAPQTPIPPPD
jgi:hypothetical protein